MYDGMISERSSDIESILGKNLKFKDNLITESMSSEFY
jgi:hypothetical protein